MRATECTVEDYNARIAKYKLKCVAFIAMRRSAEHVCLKCQHVFNRVPSSVVRTHLASTKCPNCGPKLGKGLRTLASHNLELAGSGFVCVKYKAGQEYNTYECTTCGSKTLRQTGGMVNGTRLVCATCKATAVREAYYALISELGIECSGFDGISKSAKHRCLTCGHIWYAQPRSIRDLGTGCPGACASDRRLASSFAKKTVRIGRRVLTVQGYEPEAISYLESVGCNISKLAVSSADGKPTVPYTMFGKEHCYVPDFYYSPKNRIIEVKSLWTLFGSNGEYLNKNQTKALATLDAGYDFSLLLFDTRGFRIRVPKLWYAMSYHRLCRLLKRAST